MKMEELKSIAKEKFMENRIKDIVDTSSPGAIELASEIVNFLSKKDDLIYSEIYQALDIAYKVIESQSIYACFKPITSYSISSNKIKE